MRERALRIITAVAAYDGHDASVLALNRTLLAGSLPVEIIYLGFNMTGSGDSRGHKIPIHYFALGRDPEVTQPPVFMNDMLSIPIS